MSVEFVGRGAEDGIILGRTGGNGSKVGFYGTTPVALQTASTAVGTASVVTTGASDQWGFASSTQADALVTGINSIIVNSAAYGIDM